MELVRVDKHLYITDGCSIMLKIVAILIACTTIFLLWLACDIDKVLFCMVSLSLTFFTAL